MAAPPANCTLQNLKAVLLRNLRFPKDPFPAANSANSAKSSPVKASHKDDKRRRHSIRNAIPALENASTDVDLITENAETLLDVFFTLHLIRDAQNVTLLYVSEIIGASLNPTFGHISLPALDSRKTHDIRLKVWCKRPLSVEKDWAVLYQLDLSLLRLVYIGPSISDKEDYLANNTAIFNFNDRFFTVPGALKVPVSSIGDSTIRTTSNDPLLHATPSYSFEAIRMLNSLQKSIRELSASKRALCKQISALIHVLDYADSSNSDKYRLDVTTLDKHIIKQRSLNDTIHSEILSRKVQINNIKQLMDDKFPSIQEMYTNQIDMMDSQIEPITETLTQAVYPAIIQSLQRLTLLIHDFIPIETINAGNFSIATLEFPLSIKEVLETCYYNEKQLRVWSLGIEIEDHGDLDPHSANIDQINAGLSHIVQLTNHLADITGVALKHRMVLNGSKSYIVDSTTAKAPVLQHIKAPEDANAPKVYPLYYDERLTEKMGQYPGSDHANRKFHLRNAPFEQGLNLLRRNLAYLVNTVSDAYDQYYQQERAKTQASNNIPARQLESPLWTLQYVVLFVSALAKSSQ